MKKLTIILSIILLIIILVVLFYNRKKDIKIGFSASLTGIHSSLGLGVRDGINLALEQINSSGGINGRKIKLIVKDDKNNTDIAIKNSLELIEKGVKVIIGNVTSGMTEPVIPIINENNMLLISPTVSSNNLIGKDDNFISVHPPNKQEQASLVNYVINETNIRKIAILYDLSNEGFTIDWKNYFKNRFTENGGIITKEISYNSNDDNFNYIEHTEKVLDSNSEGILLITNDIDAAIFCQQIRKVDKNVQFFLQDGH